MATYDSVQLGEDYRRYPIDDHGKYRIQYFSVAALTVALAANDQINLFRLPPGRKRVLPCLSRFTCSAFGAGRTIDIGTRAYNSRPPADADQEAEAGDVFVNGLDVSAANNAVAFGTVLKYDLYSVGEIDVFLTILGGTMPVGASLSGFLTYVVE